MINQSPILKELLEHTRWALGETRQLLASLTPAQEGDRASIVKQLAHLEKIEAELLELKPPTASDR